MQYDIKRIWERGISDVLMQSHQRKLGVHTDMSCLHKLARVDPAEGRKRYQNLPERRRNANSLIIFRLLRALALNGQ